MLKRIYGPKFISALAVLSSAKPIAPESMRQQVGRGAAAVGGMGAETTGKGYAGIITHRNLRVSRDFCQATGLTFHSEKMNLEF